MAPVVGGRAWRVSAEQLPVRNPRFSPDGKHLVWTVQRGAAPEVVAASTEGHDFRQLTYWGNASTAVKGFAPNGDVIVTSAFERTDPRHAWAYRVPLNGGQATEVPYGPVDTVVYGPELGDERPVIIGSVLTREPAAWKRYRGGTAGKLWMDGDGSGEFSRFAKELEGNLADPMWVGNRIVFLSDHEGYGNLYSLSTNGSGLRRHTDHEKFYARHASTDGKRVIFESQGELWLLTSMDSEAERIDITLGTASSARQPRDLDVQHFLSDVVPDLPGRSSIVETHGTLHWLTHRDGPSRSIEVTPGVRARLGCSVPTNRAAYVADHDGVEAIYIRDIFESRQEGIGSTTTASPSTNSTEQEAAVSSLPKPVAATSSVQAKPVDAAHGHEQDSTEDCPEPAALKISSAAPLPDEAETGVLTRIDFPSTSRAVAMTASPDGTMIAVSTEYGEVFLADTKGGSLRRVSTTEHGAVSELAFSPDSKWLVWSEPVQSDGGRSRVRLTQTEWSGAIIDITDGRFNDFSPVFLPDGKFVAFLSERSFDPVYDTHRFDLSFPASTKPFLVSLAATTPSPFGPSVGGETAENSAAGESAVQESPVDVVVDADRIAERIIAVPVAQGRYDSLAAIKGGLLWLAREPLGVTGDGRAIATDRGPATQLEKFDFVDRELTVLVDSLDQFRVSGDGQRLVIIDGSTVRSVPITGPVDKGSAESVDVDLSRIRVKLEPAKVWKQAFDEAWRLQRDFFWTEDMGGLNWQLIYDRYCPLIDRIGSHDDLVDVLWELHGELGTSHAYVRPRNRTPGVGRQGFLGAEFEHTKAGWMIRRVLPGESSDPQAVSPLAAPGAAVEPGDILEAIDGNPLSQMTGPSKLLAGAAGKAVELSFKRTTGTDDEPVRRRIAVVPLADESRLRYQNWVTDNRRTVREATQGRFGYLHIPDMVASGWAQLHRDFDKETSLDALIIDVRRNRGGHTSQLVAELIGRKVTAWQIPRGRQPSTYPANAPRGPVVVLTDEFAGSDGDIITQVVKLRGIGPVIGMRTWGGVVGIDGKFSLADGTAVTQPRYAFWMTGGVGWGVENWGVEPDIEVPFPPHAYAAGEDPQLEHGVAILREMIAEIPTEHAPERTGYASLQPMALPQRPDTGTEGAAEGPTAED
ncbi:S41 family peptidase [Arthrobacter roseus]